MTNTTPTEKWEKYNLVFGHSLRFKDEFPEIKDLKDRFEHTYVVGKTGMGKSSLLEHMAQHDIEFGSAIIFIDPKGDSTKKLYQQTKDKTKIQYISIENPTVINPLHKEGYKLDNLIQEFIQILDVLITLTASNPESTVLMREIITMSMRTIKKDELKNLNYLTKFLLYSDVRDKQLKTLNPLDEEYKYWKEFDSPASKNKDKIDCAKRVASRLLEISSGEMKDFIVGKNELDISEIVQQGKVVLVDTSRMNRNSRIYLSNLIVYAVLSYCDFAKKKDKPLLVYVDEFQIVVSSLFTELLARSRSSNVGFTLAHQTFHQIPRNILSDIFGTVNTQICFRCGDEEAQRFSSVFSVKSTEIFNLPKYNAWLRIGIDNILIETFPPKPISNNLIDLPQKNNQTSIEFPEKEYNFLGEGWITLSYL
ncbi:MAG: type IV secretion system DNA-binding domain-containing protein [Ignavibacteria bacterium]|nr:type IV secretion system DNA-binding domain-containing protein [Ignavibacteria bacterium]